MELRGHRRATLLGALVLFILSSLAWTFLLTGVFEAIGAGTLAFSLVLALFGFVLEDRAPRLRAYAAAACAATLFAVGVLAHQQGWAPPGLPKEAGLIGFWLAALATLVWTTHELLGPGVEPGPARPSLSARPRRP